MDRFRIRAIAELMQSGQLSDTQYTMALNALQHKVRIFQLGAAKRNKHDSITYYDTLIQQLIERQKTMRQ